MKRTRLTDGDYWNENKVSPPILYDGDYPRFNNSQEEYPRLLTRFFQNELPRYKKAIELFKEKYNDYGMFIYDYALYYKGESKDLGHFWEIFDKLK